MDGLTGYQQRRLELADTIRALLPVTRAYRDEEREQQVRELLTRLAAGRFQLAVIGQFSRGKTTLMNALLGGAYLPTGALPMTSVVTTVRYGTRPRALVRSHTASLPVEVPVPEVARFVARASAERTRMQVTSVEVEIPAELLRLGFEFVDTPGVGSAIAANTAATLRYLPSADALVFVTGFDSALTRAEADFLTSAAGQAGKLFLVINKRDLVSDAEAADVTSYVQDWARASLPAGPPVFAISALHALHAAVAGHPEAVIAGGIGSLRDALTRFLTAEQGRVALGNVAAGAAALVGRQQRDLRAGQLSRGGDPASDSVVADFESRVSELQAQLATVAARIDATTATAVTAVLTDRAAAWKADLTGLLATAAAEADGVAEADGDPVPGALADLRLAGRRAAGDWLEQRAAELRETLISAAAQDIGILLDLAESPRELGAAAAGLPVGDSPPGGWAAQEIPQLTVPVVEWTVPEPPAARRRPRRSAGTDASRVVSTAADSAVAGFAGRAGAAFRAVAAEWARQLGEQARRQASAGAAQFRRYLSAAPRDEDVALLDDLADQLARFRAGLAGWVPDGSHPAPGPDNEAQAASMPGASAACAICGQLEAAQAEYLIRRQFLLATSDAEQARHADTGGFCPLHTWQYARLASPVGISAGNARLASQLAGALRDAGAGSRDPAELAAQVAGLAQARPCPACTIISATERQAAANLAAQPPAAAGLPVLCLRHVALVLQSCSALPAGRAMTGALAAALQRASENMRAYALKREALRRGLITADEASAYSDALRLLAGHPALALPAQPE